MKLEQEPFRKEEDKEYIIVVGGEEGVGMSNSALLLAKYYDNHLRGKK